MAKTTTPAVVDQLTAPTDIGNLDNVATLMETTTRSRPVIAINEKGQLVVCCKTTAKKHGWEVQGKLYSRTRSGTRTAINTKGELVAEVASLASEPAALKPRTQARRKADIQVAKAVKALHTVEELLK